MRTITPLYPPKFALDPKAPKSMVQVAYVAVAEDGAVTGVTVAPMLYYRDFEPYITSAVRQWKFDRHETRLVRRVRDGHVPAVTAGRVARRDAGGGSMR